MDTLQQNQLRVFTAITLPHGATIVKELNADVLTKTFNGKGVYLADVYSSPHKCKDIVLHGSCAPVNSTLVETIRLTY